MVTGEHSDGGRTGRRSRLNEIPGRPSRIAANTSAGPGTDSCVRHLWLYPTSVLFLSACGSPPVVVLGVSLVKAPIDDATGVALECAYEADPKNFTLGLLMDTAAAGQFSLPFTVRNDASSERDGARPLRMDVTWDCEANGFSGSTGPLVVPAFEPKVPFCNDRRADVSTFVGFDVVPVSGGRIAGEGGLGVAMAQVVPSRLAQGLDETFRVAALAEACCHDSQDSGCDGQAATPACLRLGEIFAGLDPTGELLRVSASPGPSEDLLRFAAFSPFNGGTHCARFPADCDASFLQGPSYRMRLRGVMELMADDGSLIHASEATADIDFCRNCGFWDGNQRWPATRGVSQCLSL